jgi:hypothetical protein
LNVAKKEGFTFSLITKSGKKPTLHSINLDPDSQVVVQAKLRIQTNEDEQRKEKEELRTRQLMMEESD